MEWIKQNEFPSFNRLDRSHMIYFPQKLFSFVRSQPREKLVCLVQRITHSPVHVGRCLAVQFMNTSTFRQTHSCNTLCWQAS